MNFNVGVLGHVDAGKTTLVRALSTVLSTAALDKHPQSQERGITLDLGFSSFSVGESQITLVDCPGHASLLKTIIGGAQIIDMMLLVVDAQKGIQAQTAECLVIGEVLTTNLVVVINKVDLVSESQLIKARKRVTKALSHTRFSGAELVEVSALESSVESLVKVLTHRAQNSTRADDSGAFLVSIDHCFSIKGHGTVVTGTVLQGQADIRTEVTAIASGHLPTKHRLKGIQRFRETSQSCHTGDRVGLCLANLEASAMERGWVTTDVKSIPSFNWAIVSASRIKFYTSHLKSRTKLNVSIGHMTIPASTLFFRSLTGSKTFTYDEEFKYVDELVGDLDNVYCLLQFDRPLSAPMGSTYIASSLNHGVMVTKSKSKSSKTCRIAFHGKLLAIEDTKDPLEKLRVFRMKTKFGVVDRLIDQNNCLIRFPGSTIDPRILYGLHIQVQKTRGVIGHPFGTSGKLKCSFKLPLNTTVKEDAKGKSKLVLQGDNAVSLPMKKYLGDKTSKIIQ